MRFRFSPLLQVDTHERILYPTGGLIISFILLLSCWAIAAQCGRTATASRKLFFVQISLAFVTFIAINKNLSFQNCLESMLVLEKSTNTKARSYYLRYTVLYIYIQYCLGCATMHSYS